MAKKLTDADLKEIEKDVRPRMEEARTARDQIQPYVNMVYKYALPGRRRLGEERVTPDDTGKGQHIIFDSELQFDLREAASEMKNIYTPQHRPWADLEPRKSLPEEIAESEELKNALQGEQNKLFEAMRLSRIDTALDLAWEDWLITTGAIEINPGKGGRAALVEWVPLHEMTMEMCAELPAGIDGRWRERQVKRRYLKMCYPMVDWDEVLKKKRKAAEGPNAGAQTFKIAHGYRYDGNAWPRDRWFFEVFFEGELVHHKAMLGEGVVGLIPFRAGESSPSPWGRGPASIALSPGRCLDQLAYMNLKVLPKRVDPPMWGVRDGVFNPDQPITAGSVIPTGPEFKMGLIESAHKMGDFYEEVEQLRFMVKRALWQDRPDPYEAGTTPPTAYQIQQQELGRAVRQERPRARINPELIVPVLERFIHIESKAKRMAPIRVKGMADAVAVAAKSPLQRAADLEDVQQAQLMLSIMQQFLAEKGVMSLDIRRTMTSIRDRLGAGARDLVHLRSQEEIVEEMAVEAGAQTAGAAAGESLALQQAA